LYIKAYLYIGHRQENFDDLLTTRSTEEHIYDEFIFYDSVDNQIMTPFQENQQNKICEISTNRLWKPWKNLANQNIRNWIMNSEGPRLNAYDKDSNTTRNVTIGIGKLIHHGSFVATQAIVDKIIAYLKKQKISITLENIVENVGPATGLTDTNLTKVKQEMAYINGMTKQEILDSFKNTFDNHVEFIERDLHVPLHKCEYAVLCDLAYNRGKGTIYNPNDNDNNGDRRYGTHLNAGKYYYTGSELILNNARKHVPNRRDDEKKVWFDGVPNSVPTNILEYQPNNRTPWNHVLLDN